MSTKFYYNMNPVNESIVCFSSQEAAARPSEGNEGPVGETPSGPPRDPQGGFVLSIIRLLLSSQPQQGVTSGLAFAVGEVLEFVFFFKFFGISKEFFFKFFFKFFF